MGDIDVAVLLRPEQASGKGMPNLLEHVRELLIQVYDPKERVDYTLGRHAVRIYFRGINLSVDVVPIIPEAGREGFALLPTRDSNEWVSTSIPRHMQFIRKRSGMHPVLLELVRLVKWWRNERGVHFKSFLIELLSVHLLDTEAVPRDDLHEALLGFFGYIVRTGLCEPISFNDYCDTPEVVGTDDIVRVFDPVNPSNNVALAIDELRRRELVDACRGAFEALAAAQTAPTAALARAYYQRVFGPQFTLPEDAPGEPSSPTPADYVKAKIFVLGRVGRQTRASWLSEKSSRRPTLTRQQGICRHRPLLKRKVVKGHERWGRRQFADRPETAFALSPDVATRQGGRS